MSDSGAEPETADVDERATMSEKNRDEPGLTTAGLFDRLAVGDPKAVDDLLAHFRDRLHRQVKKLFAHEERLRTLYETDDVGQGAAVRLMRAIAEEKPNTPRHLMRLAAQAVRRELCDLARKEYGPHGDGGRVYANRLGEPGEGGGVADAGADSAPGPQTAAQVREVHEQIEKLPADVREVFDLIFYLGLEQSDVARQLGVSASTVTRRYREARLLLYEALGGDAGLT